MLSKITDYFRILTPVILFFISFQMNSIEKRFSKIENQAEGLNNRMERFEMDLSQRISRLEAIAEIKKKESEI